MPERYVDIVHPKKHPSRARERGAHILEGQHEELEWGNDQTLDREQETPLKDFQHLLNSRHTWYDIQQIVVNNVRRFHSLDEEERERLLLALCWKYLEEPEHLKVEAQESIILFAENTDTGISEQEFEEMCERYLYEHPLKLVWFAEEFRKDLKNKSEWKQRVEVSLDQAIRSNLKNAGLYDSQEQYSDDSRADPLNVAQNLCKAQGKSFDAGHYEQEIDNAIGVALAQGNLARADELIVFREEHRAVQAIPSNIRQRIYLETYARHADEVQQGYIEMLKTECPRWSSSYRELDLDLQTPLEALIQRLGIQPDWNHPELRERAAAWLDLLLNRGCVWLALSLSELSGAPISRDKLELCVQENYLLLLREDRWADIEAVQNYFHTAFPTSPEADEIIKQKLSNLFLNAYMGSIEINMREFETYRTLAPHIATTECIIEFFTQNLSTMSSNNLIGALKLLRQIKPDADISSLRDEINKKMAVEALMGHTDRLRELEGVSGYTLQPSGKLNQVVVDECVVIQRHSYEEYVGFIARAKALGLYTPIVQKELKKRAEQRFAREEHGGEDQAMRIQELQCLLLVGFEPTHAQKKVFAKHLREQFIGNLKWYGVTAVNLEEQDTFMKRLGEPMDWKSIQPLIEKNIGTHQIYDLLEVFLFLETRAGISLLLPAEGIRDQIKNKMRNKNAIIEICRGAVWDRFREEVQEELSKLVLLNEYSYVQFSPADFEELKQVTGRSAEQLLGRAATNKLKECIASQEIRYVRSMQEKCKAIGLPPLTFDVDGEMYQEARIMGAECQLMVHLLDVFEKKPEYLNDLSQERRVVVCMKALEQSSLYAYRVIERVFVLIFPHGQFTEPLRSAIREAIVREWKNQKSLSQLFQHSAFDESIFQEISSENVQYYYKCVNPLQWGEMRRLSGSTPNFSDVSVKKSFFSEFRRRLITNGSFKEAKEWLDLWSHEDQLLKLQLTQFSQIDVSYLIRQQGFGKLEELLSEPVTGDTSFAYLLSCKNLVILRDLCKQKWNLLTEEQRAQLRKAARDFFLERAAEGQFIGVNVFAELEQATGESFRIDATQEQEAVAQKAFAQSSVIGQWRFIAEFFGIHPNLENQSVKARWEKMLHSLGSQRKWDEAREWRSWGIQFGWDRTWQNTDTVMKDQLDIVYGIIKNRDMAGRDAFEDLFQASFNSNVEIFISCASDTDCLFDPVNFFENLEPFAVQDPDLRALVSSDKAQQAKQRYLERQTEKHGWATVLACMKAWDMKPRKVLIHQAKVEILARGEMDSTFDHICELLGGVELSAEDFRFIPSDLSMRQAARFYGSSLPKAGVERAKAVALFRAAHPKYDCVANLLLVRGPTKREEFCPYVRMESLWRRLEGDGYLMEDRETHLSIQEYAVHFGLEYLPVLCKTVIELFREKRPFAEAMLARADKAPHSLVRQAIELVGTQEGDTPLRILDRFKAFQNTVAEYILFDREFPPGFESNLLAMELFNALVPFVGEYSHSEGRKELITKSRREPYPIHKVPIFLTHQELNVSVYAEDEQEDETTEAKVRKIEELIRNKASEEQFLAFLKPWREGMKLSYEGQAEPEWWLGRIEARWMAQKCQMEQKVLTITNEKGRVGLQKQIDSVAERIERLKAVQHELRTRTNEHQADDVSRLNVETHEETLRALQRVFEDDKGNVDRVGLVKAASEEAYGLMYAIMSVRAPAHTQAIRNAELFVQETVQIANAWVRYFIEEYLEHFCREDQKQLSPDLLELAHTLWRTKGIADTLREKGLSKEGGSHHPVADVGCTIKSLVDKKMRLLNSERDTKTETLNVHPVMGLGRALAGDIANACFDKHRKEFIEGKYQGITALLFTLGAEKEIAGSTLCVNTKNKAGERVLVIRAPNPTESVIQRKLDSESFLLTLVAYYVHAAEIHNAAHPKDPIQEVHLCYDHKGGHSTNREPVFAAMTKLLKTGVWKDAPISDGLEDTPDTNFNRYAIYTPGQTRVVWRKQ